MTAASPTTEVRRSKPPVRAPQPPPDPRVRPYRVGLLVAAGPYAAAWIAIMAVACLAQGGVDWADDSTDGGRVLVGIGLLLVLAAAAAWWIGRLGLWVQGGSLTVRGVFRRHDVAFRDIAALEAKSVNGRHHGRSMAPIVQLDDGEQVVAAFLSTTSPLRRGGGSPHAIIDGVWAAIDCHRHPSAQP